MSPAYPAFSLFSFPLSPRPPSPAGKGRFFCFLMQGAPPLASPRLNPRGTYNPCQAGAKRGACLLCRPPPLPLVFFLPPIPPAPFPGGEGGIKVIFMQGAPPLASPALDRLRHLQSLPSRCPAQREVHGLPPEWQEMLSFEQCRQPRRGGTGGEELRRLRWSSPPGQSEPVPQGFSPLRVRRRQGKQATKKASPPPGTANAPPSQCRAGASPPPGASPLSAPPPHPRQ